jgi:hypothetical protein
MCKEIPVIPVNRVVDLKRIIGKNGGLRRRSAKNFAEVTNKQKNTSHRLYYILMQLLSRIFSLTCTINHPKNLWTL